MHMSNVGSMVTANNGARSEEHTSELQSHVNLVCRLLLEKKKKNERVKRFAKKMIDDRAMLEDGLVRASKNQGVRVVPELMPYQKTTIDWMARLKGIAFYREDM